ncbi:MAG: hypothetical protein ACC645_26210, partial [Pirellulales bacterium]
IPLTVENPPDFLLSAFPVTSEVPFARGELGNPLNVRLFDQQGNDVCVQPVVAVRWQDGSVKWLRLSFLASTEAKSVRRYTLAYGTEVQPAPAKSVLNLVRQGDELVVNTGPLRVRFDARRSGDPTRIVFYAGSPFVRVYTTWGNDREEARFTSFERFTVRVPLSDTWS